MKPRHVLVGVAATTAATLMVLFLAVLPGSLPRPGIMPPPANGRYPSNALSSPTVAAPTPHLLRAGVAPSTGVTLRTGNGTWTNFPTSFAYQWERCNTSGSGCTNILGATSQTYVVQAADVGHTIRVVVTATNSSGSASQTSAATGVVTSPSGVLLFDGTFDSPVSKGTPSPWTAGPQCANYGTPTNTNHYPGDFYFDNGTSTSISPGANFNAATSATVPPGQGADSARIVLPIPPSGHNLEFCTIHGLQTPTPGDLGTDLYYGVMLYLPQLMQINSSAFQGENTWEFHIHGPPIWGAPIIWQLHTSGPSAVHGTSDSLVLALETGACHAAGTPSPGCQYRSNAAAAPCTTHTDTSTPSLGTITCLPGYFAIPPGQLKYGQWNEVVMHVHWSACTTFPCDGAIDTYYKTPTDTTWTASASVTGIATVQWDVTKGCCGYPVGEDLEQYGGLQTAPYSMNLDNQLIGTSLATVENAMPTTGVAPVAPANAGGTALPAITGTAQQGVVLSASNGTWTGTPAPSFTYQWRQCDSSGASCTDIVGATAATYTPTSVDVGHTIRVVVTATNSAGTASATSAQTGVVASPASGPGTGAGSGSCSGSCGVGAWTTVSLTPPSSANPPSPRKVEINVPTNLNCAAGCPLVVVAAGTTAVTVSDGTSLDFADYAPTGHYITARIEAPVSGGYYTSMPFSHQNTGCPSGGSLCDDEPMIASLVAYMEAHYTIDTTRIFFTGGSKGGSMTEDMACDPRINGTFAGFSVQSIQFPTATGSTSTSPVACPAVNGFTNWLGDGWAQAPPIGSIGSPVPSMYQYVVGLTDNVVNNGGSPPGTCTQSTNLATSCAYNGYIQSNGLYQLGQKGVAEKLLAPAWSCTASPTTATTIDTGVSVHTYSSSCDSGPNNAIAIQNVSIPTSCHSDSCVGSAGYDLARGAWKFWTAGDTSPA